MTVYENDKGTRWKIKFEEIDIRGNGKWRIIRAISRAKWWYLMRDWWPDRQSAQVALDAMAVKRGLTKVEEGK